MSNLLMQAYIAVDLWIRGRVEAFKNEERGAVDIVAIVLLIVIAVAIAIIFKDKIAELVQNLIPKGDDVSAALTVKNS